MLICGLMRFANETLPAVADVLPALAEFDSWDVAQCESVLRKTIPHFAQLRFYVGLTLYRLRILDDDPAFKAHEDGYAADIGVDPRTLRRWRQKAEETAGLPPATARSEGQRGKGQNAPKPKTDKDATAPDAEQLVLTLDAAPADDLLTQIARRGSVGFDRVPTTVVRAAFVALERTLHERQSKESAITTTATPTVDGHRHQAKATKGGSGMTRCECGAVKVGNRWVKR